LLANLDVVISVDTAILHLAGAMGRPTWAMLAEPADWRWMRARPDSPWYPSLRLFRQHRPGAWDGVVSDIATALRQTHICAQTDQEASP
jgi:ADP-heptose:LPS heptosyltransferase